MKNDNTFFYFGVTALCIGCLYLLIDLNVAVILLLTAPTIYFIYNKLSIMEVKQDDIYYEILKLKEHQLEQIIKKGD